jgi:hypothetical protein
MTTFAWRPDMRNLRHLAAVLALGPALALAQAPAAAPGAVPAPSCAHPGEHPGRLASDNQVRNWAREARAYLECLKKFVDDQKALALPLLERAKPHQDAANAAIDLYNKSQKEFVDQQEKANAAP